VRIALVVTGGLHPSGREQVVPVLLAFAAHLARIHEVHAFALNHLATPQSYQLRGFAVHDLGRPHGHWRKWRALNDALDVHGPFDVVHGYWADPAGLLAAFAGRRLRIPSVVTCDSGEFVAIPELGYGLQQTHSRRLAVSIACRWAAAVHVASHYMQHLAQRRGIDTVRIPLGVEALTGRGEPSDGPPWQLLQVASLNRIKDQPMLLRAIAELRRSTDVRLDLVGEDTLDGELQRLSARLDLVDAVRFHGFVPHDALGPYYRRAHLYVQSSRHEGGGISVLEAAAAGLPVVGTRVGFVSDWAGTASVAVPPGDAHALAAAISSTLGDRQRRSDLARAASSIAADLSPERTASDMARLYESLARRA
jgi:glycosyltransferase involved in cell wall biosynthesis